MKRLEFNNFNLLFDFFGLSLIMQRKLDVFSFVYHGFFFEKISNGSITCMKDDLEIFRGTFFNVKSDQVSVIFTRSNLIFYVGSGTTNRHRRFNNRVFYSLIQFPVNLSALMQISSISVGNSLNDVSVLRPCDSSKKEQKE